MAIFWRDSVITYCPKSHNRKNKNKRLAKRKISHHKKRKKGKRKKRRKKRGCRTRVQKRTKKNKNRKLSAVYYCVAYSIALRSRQTKEVLGGSSAAFSCCCCCGPSSLCLRGGHPEAVFWEPTETTPRASLLLHSAYAAASWESTRIVILLTR
jgi:hypothetical protein